MALHVVQGERELVASAAAWRASRCAASRPWWRARRASASPSRSTPTAAGGERAGTGQRRARPGRGQAQLRPGARGVARMLTATPSAAPKPTPPRACCARPKSKPAACSTPATPHCTTTATRCCSRESSCTSCVPCRRWRTCWNSAPKAKAARRWTSQTLCDQLRRATDALNTATTPFAGRRMDARVRQALAGQRIDQMAA
jgi:hypothetical protein